MNYKDFLLNISKNNKFKIVHENYDESFFGNFQIALLFYNSLKLEIVNDRGTIEIYILYLGVFNNCHIPLCFAVNYLEKQDCCENLTFENIFSANEFLFNNVDALELIIKNNLLKDIARQWTNYKNKY